MPTIKCPNCDQKYEVDESTFGNKARCEMCNNLFIIQNPYNIATNKHNHNKSDQKKLLFKISIIVILLISIIYMISFVFNELQKNKVSHKSIETENLFTKEISSKEIVPNKKEAQPQETTIPKKDVPIKAINLPQDKPAKKITSIAGIQFGSKPRGETIIKDKTSDGWLTVYSPCETIKTDSSLFPSITVYYTPISKKLYYMSCPVSYNGMQKIANLFNEKYGCNITLESNSSNISYYTYTVTSGSARIGDVQIHIQGAVKSADFTGSGRKTNYDQEGKVTLIDHSLSQIAVSEYTETPKYKKEKKEEEEKKKNQQRERDERIKRETEKHQKELDEI